MRVAIVVSSVLLIAVSRSFADPPHLGYIGSGGSASGQFSSPFGLVEDQGLLYVADYGNSRIQVLTLSGDFVRAWGSQGFGPGQFDTPTDLAVDADHVYVVDGFGHRVQKFTRTGVFVAQWGVAGAGPGQFSTTIGIAVGGGFVYVADYDNHRIQKFTASGTFVSIIGQAGYEQGQFQNPIDVEVGPDGLVYVADSFNHRIQVFQADGTWVRSWGGQGSALGQFFIPNRLSFDGDRVLVCDTANDRVQVFTLDGTFVTAWGSSGTGPGQMEGPVAIAADASGRCYVLERQNHRIQVFGPPVTGVGDRPRVAFAVSPNPSSGPITVHFDLQGISSTRLTIVDLAGRRLGDWRLPGSTVFSWDGKDRAGQPVRSGTYFARLEAGTFTTTRVFHVVR